MSKELELLRRTLEIDLKARAQKEKFIKLLSKEAEEGVDEEQLDREMNEINDTLKLYLDELIEINKELNQLKKEREHLINK